MVLVKGCIPKEEADKMLDEVRLAPIAESKVDREPGVHDLEFADLENLTGKKLIAMVGRAASRNDGPEAQEAAVRKLRDMERGNVAAARELLGL